MHAVLGENGVLWVSSAVNFPVVCSCLRVALACTPKLERHHAERALRRSRDLLGQEPTSPSLRAPNDMGKSAPKRASDADQDERPAEAKAGSGQEPPPSGAGGGTDGAPAAPPAPVDSAEELRVLRKRLERSCRIHALPLRIRVPPYYLGWAPAPARIAPRWQAEPTHVARGCPRLTDRVARGSH